MGKEFLNNKLLRAAVAGAALAIATPHFESNAQVNGIQIIDCKTPEGPKSNRATMPILSGQVLVIGEAPRQFHLKNEADGVHVSGVKDGKEEELFTASPAHEVILQSNQTQEVFIRGGTINFRPEGQGMSIDVTLKRLHPNMFQADIEADCYYPPRLIRDGDTSKTD